MGGILAKHLVEKLPDMPTNIIGRISICHVYEALGFVSKLIIPTALYLYYNDQPFSILFAEPSYKLV